MITLLGLNIHVLFIILLWSWNNNVSVLQPFFFLLHQLYFPIYFLPELVIFCTFTVLDSTFILSKNVFPGEPSFLSGGYCHGVISGGKEFT